MAVDGMDTGLDGGEWDQQDDQQAMTEDRQSSFGAAHEYWERGRDSRGPTEFVEAAPHQPEGPMIQHLFGTFDTSLH